MNWLKITTLTTYFLIFCISALPLAAESVGVDPLAAIKATEAMYVVNPWLGALVVLSLILGVCVWILLRQFDTVLKLTKSLDGLVAELNRRPCVLDSHSMYLKRPLQAEKREDE